jgi:branched-chain amino acid transport system ATP-binding protein
MLTLEGVSASYGAIRALTDVSVRVQAGQFVAIVGPNGAGKTTLFRTISGQLAPSTGRIIFDGVDLLRAPARDRAHLGIAHVPEGRQVFANLTVLENIEMGATPSRGRAEWARNLERNFALFPVLAQRRTQLAGTLSGGEQQMLAIARGLASSPRLLLLDEPSMGLAPIVAEMIFDRIQTLHREEKLTVLLVEQRVAEALEPCDWAYVLDAGRCVLDGTPTSLLKDRRVRETYLGAAGMDNDIRERTS